MVPCIGHQNLILAVAGHVPGVHELSIGRALLAELEHELALHGEDLHPVVVLVRHNEPPHAVQADAGRSVELAWPGALCAKLAVQSSVPAKEKLALKVSQTAASQPARQPVEEADPVVAAVRHHYEAGRSAADAPGSTELTIARPLTAELQDGDTDCLVVPPRLHAPLERTALDGATLQRDGEGVIFLHMGSAVGCPLLQLFLCCMEFISITG